MHELNKASRQLVRSQTTCLVPLDIALSLNYAIGKPPKIRTCVYNLLTSNLTLNEHYFQDNRRNLIV